MGVGVGVGGRGREANTNLALALVRIETLLARALVGVDEVAALRVLVAVLLLVGARARRREFTLLRKPAAGSRA